jgi:hypothetical protein
MSTPPKRIKDPLAPVWLLPVTDSEEEERIVKPSALYASFMKELVTASGPTTSRGMSREAQQAINQRRERKRTYYLDFLKRLDDPEQLQEYDGEQKIRTRVAVLIDLASLDTCGGPNVEQEYLHQALEIATGSGDSGMIHKALMALGDFYADVAYSDASYYDEAVWYYREALLYAHTFWPTDMSSTLYFLGITLAKREETLREAIFILDMAGRFGPIEYHARVEAAKCRIRAGEGDELRQWVKEAKPETCDEIGDVIAVLMALGRRKKAIERLVHQGLERAEVENNRRWRYHYESALENMSEKQAAKAAE